MTNLDFIVSAIRDSFNPHKVYLFGSQATGDSRKDSDVDIAVLQDGNPLVGQKAKFYLKLLEMGYDWKIEPDIHLFDKDTFNSKYKAGDVFVNEIVSKGKVLYE